ncbi:MAG: glucose-1-phosphate thymidylyltransferase [Dehalococcoidia bacterium]
MKGLVLSGGKGSRLRPFTYTGAKQLVPIANKPVLYYALEQLVKAGIDEIGIVVGDTAAEVEAAVGDGSRFDARVSYIHQPAPLGIAHAIVVAREFLGDDRFVMMLGDNFFREGIQAIVDQFAASPANCEVVLCKVANPQEVGVAVIECGQLVRIVEKPKQFISDLAVIGIYLFDHHVHEAVAAIRPSVRGELEITDTIQYLIDAGYNVQPALLEGSWVDTGRTGDILAANRSILEIQQRRIDGSVDKESQLIGMVVVEEGAQVVGSTIEGPAIIGLRTVVENAYVGPFTSIHHDCVVRNSEIAGSVVLENTLIEAVPQRIEGSLIGRRVKLQGITRRPHTYQLILGDFSEARLP